MILDLRLPAGWTQRPIAIDSARSDPAATDISVAVPAVAVPGSGLTLAELQGGRIAWPPAADDGEESPTEAPAALLISPLLPLPRSPTRLLRTALASEPDYELRSESPYLAVRLGPWEVTALETTGVSRETGIESARLYAVLDAGYGAYMMVFVDCDPARIALRRDQLVELISEAQLRNEARPDEPSLDDLDAAVTMLDEPELTELAPAGLTAIEPSEAPAAEAAPIEAGPTEPEMPVLQAPAAKERKDDGALPLPPQRPAEDVYMGGNLFPHLVD